MEKVVPFRTGYGSGLCTAWYDGSFLFVLFTLSSARGAVAIGNSLYMFARANTQSGADGLVSGTVEYDVFGRVVTETGVFVSSSGGMTNLVFGYAGKPYDSVTGLSDYGFRDYAPSLARFTTLDPIRDGSNWYAYCNSDPVNYVDAWGLAINDIMDSRTTKATNNLNLDINTEDFARTICNNSQYLDDSTKSYVNNAGVKSVASNLNNITVVTGVDRNVVREIGNQLGLVDTPNEKMNPANGDAFSIGGYIFIFDENFDTTDSDNQYLLKHEAVHYIQSVAEGGTASFLSKYIDSVQKNGYNGSEYEMATYSFGPNVKTKSNYMVANGSGFVK